MSLPDIKTAYRKRQIISLEQQERIRIRNLPTQQPNLLNVGVPPSYQNPPQGLSIESIPRTCVEERDLPTREGLEKRMKFLAQFSGLGGEIAEESVELLLLGVQNYMKNTISCIHSKIRPLVPDRPPSTTSSSSLTAPFDSTSISTETPPSLTSSDTSTSLTTSPTKPKRKTESAEHGDSPAKRVRAMEMEGSPVRRRWFANEDTNTNNGDDSLNHGNADGRRSQHSKPSISPPRRGGGQHPSGNVSGGGGAVPRQPAFGDGEEKKRYIGLGDVLFATEIAGHLVSRTGGGLE
ncbi:hypothetical protein HK097_006815, partial [Rhizophlyctis rosea]